MQDMQEMNASTSHATPAPARTWEALAASSTNEDSVHRIVVTVLGKDRIGIIARITGVLAERKVNILDISQTIFGDLFSMTLIGDIRQSDTPFAALKRELALAGQQMGVRVLAQRQEVFERMHRP